MIVSGAFRWFFLSTSSPFVSFLYKSVLGGLLYEIVKQFYNRVKLTKIYNCVFSKYILNFGNTVMIFIGLHYYVYSSGLSRKRQTLPSLFLDLLCCCFELAKHCYIFDSFCFWKKTWWISKKICSSLYHQRQLYWNKMFYFRREIHLFL